MARVAHVIGAVVVFLAVAGLLIGTAAAMGVVTGLFPPVDDTEAPELDAEELYIEQLPAEGTVDVPAAGASEPGLVLIDDAHRSTVDEAAIQELRRALVAAGHDVRRVDSALALREELETADALVVPDPGRAYDNETAEAVQEFADDDGRVLLLGEPNRMAFDGRFLEPVESEMNSLANRLGVSFGTDYVYDMDENDGNHRNVVVTPTDDAMMSDVDRAVFYIGTHVAAADGEPVLETSPNAQRSAGETAGQYTVATRTGSVLAIGDGSFLKPDRFNVADNEELIAAIVEFLSSGGG